MIARNNKKKRSGSDSQFPGRLHDLMEYVEEKGIDKTISWVLNGRGFIVHDPDRLVELLPLFFSQTKYRSFRRQLNMWHFERIDKGPSKGAFIHPYFVRGNRDLCQAMSRHISLKPRRGTSIGSNASASSSTPSDSPSEQHSKSEGSFEILGDTRIKNQIEAPPTVPPKKNQKMDDKHDGFFGVVPSFVASSLATASSAMAFKPATTMATCTTDSVSNNDNRFYTNSIDLLVEPDPIRTMVDIVSPSQLDQEFIRRQTTKSSSSRFPSLQNHQQHMAMTVSNFINEALSTQPMAHAISSTADAFFSFSRGDNNVAIDGGYDLEVRRVVPSFVIPQHQRPLERQLPSSVATLPVLQVLPSSRQGLLFSDHNQNHRSKITSRQHLDEDPLDITFEDLDALDDLVDLAGRDFMLLHHHQNQQGPILGSTVAATPNQSQQQLM